MGDEVRTTAGQACQERDDGRCLVRGLLKELTEALKILTKGRTSPGLIGVTQNGDFASSARYHAGQLYGISPHLNRISTLNLTSRVLRILREESRIVHLPETHSLGLFLDDIGDIHARHRRSAGRPTATIPAGAQTCQQLRTDGFGIAV